MGDWGHITRQIVVAYKKTKLKWKHYEGFIRLNRIYISVYPNHQYMALWSYPCWRWYEECLPFLKVSDRMLDLGRAGRPETCFGWDSRRSISRCISAVLISLRLFIKSKGHFMAAVILIPNKFKPFSCSDGSAIGFFGSIFGLKSSHCFKTGGITGGFGFASIFVNSRVFFVGIFLSPLLRIIGLFDFRLAFISWHLGPDLVADGTLDIVSFWSLVRLDNLESLNLWLAAELCRDFRSFCDLTLLALGDCDRVAAIDCDCDGADDLKLVSFSVCCLSRTWPGLKIFLSNFSFGQSVLHHQSKSLFKHRNYSLD